MTSKYGTSYRQAISHLVFSVVISAVIAAAFTPNRPASAGQSAVDETVNLYNQYRQGIENRYESERSSIEHAYRKYRQIIEEEYRTYEREILKRWPDAEVGTAKKWVEYSPDYSSRRIVDFQNGYIKIEMQVHAGERDIDALAERELRDMLLETPETAFKRNTMLQNIEKRITSGLPKVTTGKPGNSPVLLSMVSVGGHPGSNDIEAMVRAMKQKASISRSKAKTPGTETVSVRIPFPPEGLQRKAMEYRPVVNKYSQSRGISEALVLSVMHTESAFNPMARSNVPAYGLMQIVPGAAGMDASELLFGEPVLLSPSYLYSETNNINIGTAYLYLLYYRYLKGIENPESRLYCTIAAYNTGAGNVARAFTGSTSISQAAGVINKMSPAEVYNHLTTRLSSKEARDYVRKVAGLLSVYRQ